jgi:hypothetical protein
VARETSKAGRCPADDGWQSVYIASPRRLDRVVTYSMILDREGTAETIARNVTIARALIIALEHRGYGAVMFYRDRGALREYVIGRRRLSGHSFEPVLRGLVPRTARIATDHVHALECFEEILEHDTRVFFEGRLESARDRAVRRANVIRDTT